MSIIKILKLTIADFFSLAMFKVMLVLVLIPLAVCVLVGYWFYQQYDTVFNVVINYDGYFSIFVDFIESIIFYLFLLLTALVFSVLFYILFNLTLVLFLGVFSENFVSIINDRYYQLPVKKKIPYIKIFFSTLKTALAAYFYILLFLIVFIVPLFLLLFASFNIFLLFSLAIVVYTNRVPIVYSISLLFLTQLQYDIFAPHVKNRSRVLCWLFSPLSLVPILNVFLPTLIIISQTHLILSEIKKFEQEKKEASINI